MFQTSIGVLYYYELGVNQNYQTAYEYFLKANTRKRLLFLFDM